MTNIRQIAIEKIRDKRFNPKIRKEVKPSYICVGVKPTEKRRETKETIIMAYHKVYLFILSLMAMSCGQGSQSGQSTQNNQTSDVTRTSSQVQPPIFDVDSAFHFVDSQVAFGPRVPETQAHAQAAQWLAETMERFADTVYVQQARARTFDGKIINMKNIIGVFGPEKSRRIMLCAHWDSRPFADYDPNPEMHFTAIDGANDGASSVGVLLEIARAFNRQQPDVGVDIILFDAEDYGRHRFSDLPDEDSWALGSQHWARNPHKPDYFARFGILLDMVGAEGATFLREGYSMLFAPNVVEKVWQTAGRLGYGHFFVNRDGGFITDDHYYVNTIRNIPTINIIHQDETTPHGFFPQWHTLEDNMDHINHATLRAVGETVLQVIYNER